MPDSRQNYPGSVSQEILGLKQNDPESIKRLWDFYAQQLRRLARRKIGDRPRGAADSEDIASTVFTSLCQAVKAGRFPDLHNREELWRILITLTRHASVDLIRAETSEKRGGGQSPQSYPSQFAGRDLSPEDMVQLNDQFQHLLARLPDDTFRQIAKLKIELRTVPDIAESLGVALRTVERKLRLIRQLWAAEWEQPDHE